MRFKKQNTVFRGIFIALFLCVLALGQTVYAQSAADDPCDDDYYESLKARAWLEAQREITQNQNLIFKPDSVLEYTCFDLYSAELAQDAIDMFSETTRWGTLLGADSMDKALEKLVGTAFRSYIKSNFEDSADGPYDLLGGRLTDGGRDDAPTPQPDEGIDHELGKGMLPKIVGGTYTCEIMRKVWMKAKCMNLIDNADEDGFFTFTEYQNDEDKRFLPERCDKVTRWQTERNTATENTPWTEDDMKTYMEYLNNSTCGNNNQAAFPTGLVVRNKNLTYLEKICIQPGCHYKPSNGGGGGIITTGTCTKS